MDKLWKIFSILFYIIFIASFLIGLRPFVIDDVGNIYVLCLLFPILIIPYFCFADYYKRHYKSLFKQHQEEIKRKYDYTEQIVNDNIELRKSLTNLYDENEILKIIATSPSGKKMN